MMGWVDGGKRERREVVMGGVGIVSNMGVGIAGCMAKWCVGRNSWVYV